MFRRNPPGIGVRFASVGWKLDSVPAILDKDSECHGVQASKAVRADEPASLGEGLAATGASSPARSCFCLFRVYLGVGIWV